jgi:cytochrome c
MTVASVVHAADNMAPNTLPTTMGAIERSEAKRATELLDRAVDYLQRYGPEKAFGAFGDRKSAFVSNEYYVFVVGLDGILNASGGEPSWLIGQNALDLHDAAGKYFVRDMLDMAKTSESGTIEYNWLNRIDNRVEIKTTQFRKVGKYIVCVGYYIPRASIEQAKELLDKAVAFLEKSGGNAAFKAFNDPHGGYVINDEYVFAIGLDDGKYRASGAAPNLTGTDVREVTDAAGKPLFKEMIELAKQKGGGTVDYVWRNPATNAVEEKHSFIKRVGDVLLGVGYYTKK